MFIAVLSLITVNAGAPAAAESARETSVELYPFEVKYTSPDAISYPRDVKLSVTVIYKGDQETVPSVRLVDKRETQEYNIGSMDYGQSKTWNMTYSVNADQVKSKGILMYLHYNFGDDPQSKSFTIPLSIKNSEPKFDFTREIEPTIAAKDQRIKITYKINNTGSVPLEKLTISDDAIPKSLSISSLDTGKTYSESVTVRMGSSDLVSKPQITYYAKNMPDKYSITLKSKTVTLAKPKLYTSLKADRTTVDSGGKIVFSCYLENQGNVEYTSLNVTNSILGTIASKVKLKPGESTTIKKEITATRNNNYKFYIKGENATGADVSYSTNEIQVTIKSPTPSPTKTPTAAPTLSASATISPQGSAQGDFGSGTAATGSLKVDVSADRTNLSAAAKLIFTITVTNTGSETLNNIGVFAGVNSLDIIPALSSGKSETINREFTVNQTGNYSFSARGYNSAGAAVTASSLPLAITIGDGSINTFTTTQPPAGITTAGIAPSPTPQPNAGIINTVNPSNIIDDGGTSTLSKVMIGLAIAAGGIVLFLLFRLFAYRSGTASGRYKESIYPENSAQRSNFQPIAGGNSMASGGEMANVPAAAASSVLAEAAGQSGIEYDNAPQRLIRPPVYESAQMRVSDEERAEILAAKSTGYGADYGSEAQNMPQAVFVPTEKRITPPVYQAEKYSAASYTRKRQMQQSDDLLAPDITKYMPEVEAPVAQLPKQPQPRSVSHTYTPEVVKIDRGSIAAAAHMQDSAIRDAKAQEATGMTGAAFSGAHTHSSYRLEPIIADASNVIDSIELGEYAARNWEPAKSYARDMNALGEYVTDSAEYGDDGASVPEYIYQDSIEYDPEDDGEAEQPGDAARMRDGVITTSGAYDDDMPEDDYLGGENSAAYDDDAYEMHPDEDIDDTSGEHDISGEHDEASGFSANRQEKIKRRLATGRRAGMNRAKREYAGDDIAADTVLDAQDIPEDDPFADQPIEDEEFTFVNPQDTRVFSSITDTDISTGGEQQATRKFQAIVPISQPVNTGEDELIVPSRRLRKQRKNK